MNSLEQSVYNMLFGESGEDDLKDLEVPEFDEAGGDDNCLDKMLDTITNGGSDDDIEGDDPDLRELEKEYTLTSVGGDATEVPDDLDTVDLESIEEAPPVDPDVDKHGDMMLKGTVTTGLLEESLSDDEYDEFVESGDAHVAASEGFISNEYITEALDATSGEDVFEESGMFAAKGKKFKMTKEARLKQLFESSLQIEARLHKDPYYPIMQKAYAQRRKIRAIWRVRYGSLAMRRAKKYLQALIKSNSNGLNKLAKRLVGDKKKK